MGYKFFKDHKERQKLLSQQQPQHRQQHQHQQHQHQHQQHYPQSRNELRPKVNSRPEPGVKFHAYFPATAIPRPHETSHRPYQNASSRSHPNDGEVSKASDYSPCRSHSHRSRSEELDPGIDSTREKKLKFGEGELSVGDRYKGTENVPSVLTTKDSELTTVDGVGSGGRAAGLPSYLLLHSLPNHKVFPDTPAHEENTEQKLRKEVKEDPVASLNTTTGDSSRLPLLHLSLQSIQFPPPDKGYLM